MDEAADEAADDAAADDAARRGERDFDAFRDLLLLRGGGFPCVNDIFSIARSAVSS